LGYLFTNGSQRRIVLEILAGVVGVMIIALIVDFLLVRLGRVLMPWAPRQSRGFGRDQRRLATEASS
jgi:osmoprotectant transport system permease protein